MDNTYLPLRLDEDGFTPKDPNPDVFEIYNREAKVYDTAMVEHWRTAMEGILIFAGLFSAAVTAFIIESYKTLQPDPADRTVDLLNQISQQLAGISIPVQVDAPFSPSWTAVATNILWFISLGSSLACAVAATLVQQWARNYIHTIERRPGAARRARMRMYLFEGVERFGMSRLIDGIPALLHLSLLTFLVGLVFFIQGISVPVTAVAIAILVVSVAAYLVATVLPLIAHDSPIQTPLTTGIWKTAFIQILYWVCAHAVWFTVELRSLTKIVLVLPLRPVWTAIDLIFRHFLSLISAPIPLKLHTISPLTTLTKRRRTELLQRWSPAPLSFKTLDTIRADIVRGEFIPSFWQREQRGFIWVAQFLDEDRELLSFLEALLPYGNSRNLFHPYIDGPREVVSTVFLDPSLEFPDKVMQLCENYPKSVRVHSASLNFELLINDDALSSIFATNPDHLFHFHHRSWIENPDLDVRRSCLYALTTVIWSTAAPQRILATGTSLSFQYEALGHQCSPRFWVPGDNKMIDWFYSICSSRRLGVPSDSPTGVWRPRLPYFAISELYLRVIPKLTAGNVKIVSDTLIRVHKYVLGFNSVSPPSFSVFPHQELLYCTVMELLVRLLDDCSEQLMGFLNHEVFACFHGLAYVSDQTSLDILTQILESDFWVRIPEIGGKFEDIVDAHQVTRGDSCFPDSIMQKYRVLQLISPDPHLHSDLRDPSAPVQHSFVRSMKVLIQSAFVDALFPFSDIAPDSFVPLLQQFCRLDDLSALQKALEVIETYLQNTWDRSGEVTRCRDSLRELVRSKSRREVGVQVFIRPEVAIQAG